MLSAIKAAGTHLLLIGFAIVGALLSSTASASYTFSYVGTPYTQITVLEGAPIVTTANRVTATITLDDNIGSGDTYCLNPTVFQQDSCTGTSKIISAVISDGVTTFDTANGISVSLSVNISGGIPTVSNWEISGTLQTDTTATVLETRYTLSDFNQGAQPTNQFYTQGPIDYQLAGSSGGMWNCTVGCSLSSSAPVIASSLPNGAAGMKYPPTTLVSRGTSPYRISASGLPPGLSVGGDGKISGTPAITDSGTYEISVSVVDASGQAAGPSTVSITIAVAPPPLLVLANLSDNVYSGNAGYANYHFIGNNCTLPPNTCFNVGLAAGAYTNKDNSEIVVAIRGTVLDSDNSDSRLESLSNLDSDLRSFGGSHPSRTLRTDVRDAAAFLKEIQAEYPSATITLTGHSLGGGIAQLLGQASNLPAFAFNAPGGEALYANLRSELSGLSRAENSNYANINYKLYGDQISLIGQPVGSTIELKDPPYIDLPVTDKSSCRQLIPLLPTFFHLHSMDTVIAQIADNAPQVSSVGEPNLIAALKRGCF